MKGGSAQAKLDILADTLAWQSTLIDISACAGIQEVDLFLAFK